MDRRDFIGTSLAGGAGLIFGGMAPRANANPMILKEALSLDTLQYYDKNCAGQLVLCDGIADKIIDFHTHIGLSFLFSPKLDLDREDEEAQTFFPLRGNPVDLNTYAAESFTDENHKINTKESLKQAYTKKGFNGSHTPKNLLNMMDRNRVTHSVILAIDLPLGAFSRNSETYMEAAERYNRLIPFVSVHPADKLMEHKVRKFHEQGAVGMKIHPPMQFLRANGKNCMKLTKLCGELGMPCLFHSGASNLAPDFQKDYPRIEYFWEPVQSQPETTFILAHGGINFYKELIELAVKNQNVYIELSGQPPEHIKEMLDAGLEDRILFGSDFPYYMEALPLAKTLLGTEGAPQARQKILYDNAKRLLNSFGCDKV